MRAPTGPWFVLEEAGSTQDVAATLLERPDCPDVVFTHHQLDGRGRFRRSWSSERDGSLTYSLIFHGHKGHERPWLIGMAVAIAVAQVLDARLQWPNDVVISGNTNTRDLVVRFDSQNVVVSYTFNSTENDLPQ